MPLPVRQYLHVGDGGVAVQVTDEHGPTVEITTSHFGNDQTALKFFTTREGLAVLGQMLLDASKEEFKTTEYVYPARPKQPTSGYVTHTGSCIEGTVEYKVAEPKHNIQIVLLGERQSGKSTIAKAIEEMLSGRGAKVTLLDELEEHTRHNRLRYRVPGSAASAITSALTAKIVCTEGKPLDL